MIVLAQHPLPTIYRRLTCTPHTHSNPSLVFLTPGFVLCLWSVLFLWLSTLYCNSLCLAKSIGHLVSMLILLFPTKICNRQVYASPCFMLILPKQDVSGTCTTSKRVRINFSFVLYQHSLSMCEVFNRIVAHILQLHF